MTLPPRRARAPAALAGAAALASLLVACSGGGDPALIGCPPPPPGDTYVLATMTLLDDEGDCLPIDCQPEFYACDDARTPLYAGHQWELRGDVATAGFINAPDPVNTSSTLTLSASDVSSKVGLTLELIANDVGGGAPPAITINLAGAALAGNYVDLDLTCQRTSSGIPISLFLATPFAPATLTITDVSLDAAGEMVVAVPAGCDAFAPAGILAGTFSFEAGGAQETPLGLENATVRVDGCFRVNVPLREQAVPVSPVPATQDPGCP